MSNNTNKTVSFISRQKNLIIALAIIFAILLVGYFTVIAPLMKDEVAPSDGNETVEVLPGEVLLGNRIYIYERLERGDVDKVVFHKKVVPGDTLVFRVELVQPLRHGMVVMKGYGFVGERMAVEATFTGQIIKKEEENK